MAIALAGTGRKVGEGTAVAMKARVGEHLLSAASLLCLFDMGLAGVLSILAMRSAQWRLQPGELDLLTALPAAYWLLLAVGTLAGVALLAFAHSEAMITASVAGIAFLYGPSFLLGLYPAIAGWDTYLHSAPAASLLAGQGLPSNNLYASQYPGPACLLAIVSGVTGFTPVDTALVITVGADVSLALIWMGIAGLFMGRRAAAWTALGVLALTPAIATNDHFSPFFISYVLTWAMLLLLGLAIRSRLIAWGPISISLLLLVGSMIISHPFMPVVATSLVGGCAVWAWRTRSEKTSSIGWFILSATVAVMSWMFYVATSYFGTGVSFLRDVLLGTQDAVDSWTGLSLLQVLQRSSDGALAIIALRWSAYAGVGLVAVSGLLLRRQRPQVAVLLGLSVAGLAGAMVGLASAAAWIQRFLYLVPPLLVVAAGISALGWVRRFKSGSRVRVAGAVFMFVALPVGLVVWHPPTLVSSVHPGEVGFAVWPQETAGAAFVAKLQGASSYAPPVVAGSDLQTMIVYSYFDPANSAFERGISMGSNLQEAIANKPLMFDGNYIIRSQRQNIVSYQAQDLGPVLWSTLDSRLNTNFECLYDNGFVRVYHGR